MNMTYGSLSYRTPILTKYFAGQTKNASILSWQGLEENTNFTEEFNKLFKSNTERIKIHDKIKYYNYNIFRLLDQELPDQVISKWKSPTDKTIVPYGTCKVFSGKPLYYLEFEMKEESTRDDYFVLMFDSAAANSFQEDPISSLTTFKYCFGVFESNLYPTTKYLIFFYAYFSLYNF